LIFLSTGNYGLNLGIMSNNVVVEYVENGINFQISEIKESLPEHLINKTNLSGFIINQMPSYCKPI